MVSARPDATWLARSVSASTPNSAAITAPLAMAATKASVTLLVAMTVEKPAMAPTIIMPSTPRLSTPERSAISSPVAANRSGVAAIMALIRMLARSSTGQALRSGQAPHGPDRRLRCGARTKGRRGLRDPARSVVDEHIGGKQKKQEHALEHGGGGTGQAHGDLGRLPANGGERQQQPRKQDADGVEPAQERDDDGREAVARGQRRDELSHRARRLQEARKTGASARHEEAKPDQFLVGKAAVASGPRRLAQHLDLETQKVPLEQHPGEEHRAEPHQEPHVRARPRDEDWQRCLEQAAFRKVEAVRVAQSAMHQGAQDEHGHVNQHQADEDLVGIEAGAQQRWNGGPGGTADNARQAHQRQQPPARGRIKRQRYAPAGQRADGELPLR